MVGRKVQTRPPTLEDLTEGRCVTRVVLATAHRDHGTANNPDANLAA